MKNLATRMQSKAYLMGQSIKDRFQTRLNNEKGGIENYITILIIVAIVLLIGWAVWRYFAGANGGNVIANWFESNVSKIIDCTSDVSGGTGSNNC